MCAIAVTATESTYAVVVRCPISPGLAGDRALASRAWIQRLSVITLGVEDVPRAPGLLRAARLEGHVHRRRHRDVPGGAHDRLAVESRRSSPRTRASRRRPPAGAASRSATPCASAAEVDAVCAAGRRGGRDRHTRARRRCSSATRACSPTPTGTPGRSLGRGARPARRRQRGAAVVNGEELRAFCLRLPGAAETFPFEPGVSVFKAANGKMFAVSVTASEPLAVSVKCDPELAVGAARRVRLDRRGLPPQQAPLDHGHARLRLPGRARAAARRGQLRPGQPAQA